MLPLDLSKAQVYQYTSGVASARRFRPLASVATKPKAQLPLKTRVLATAKEAVSLPVKAAAAAQESVHTSAVAEHGVATTRDLGEKAEQKPLAKPAKVSREWYVDDVVER